MENKKSVAAHDIKVELEDYNVDASPVMQEMEASWVGSVITIDR
ncbi:hypothetical protein [Halobacillus litoralis]|nr:hypothetical protein [Halobacillus litoralis]